MKEISIKLSETQYDTVVFFADSLGFDVSVFVTKIFYNSFQSFCCTFDLIASKVKVSDLIKLEL